MCLHVYMEHLFTASAADVPVVLLTCVVVSLHFMRTVLGFRSRSEAYQLTLRLGSIIRTARDFRPCGAVHGQSEQVGGLDRHARAGDACQETMPACMSVLSLQTVWVATQTLSYAGQHMADDKRLMEYHVPAVRLR